MKPDAPAGIRSIFQPIRTVVPGIDICDQMPLLAQVTDRIAFVRSMSHPSNVHEASVYHTLTGKQNPTLISPRNFRRRTDFPNFGSVISRLQPPGVMPASVTIPRPIGHDGVTYAGTYGGFLGPRLVDAGVRLVSVIWMYFMPNGRISNVWDTHGGTAGLGSITGFAMLKEKYCIPPLDRAYSALLLDIADRGILEETLVVMVGEFGRTSQLNPSLVR